MLVHITPKLYISHWPHRPKVTLVSVEVPEAGLVLRGDSEVVARKPFPNQRVWVGCRSRRKKAVGLLLEVEGEVRTFTAVVTWAVDAERVLRHRTTYSLLECERGLATDNMLLWAIPGFDNRWPGVHASSVPVHAQPRMDAWGSIQGGARRREVEHECVGVDGTLEQRFETFAMPTVEPERLDAGFYGPFPARTHAFRVEICEQGNRS